MINSTITLEDIYDLSFSALVACGASEVNANPVAESIRDAEADGIRNVGLAYLSHYCEHLLCGKVKGDVEATWQQVGAAAIQVDALHGFAHSAFSRIRNDFVDLVRQSSVGTLAIMHSYAAGVIGWYVEQLANDGLIALAFANSPPAIAPWGGKQAFFGTNPLAFAVPRANNPPLVIDQSSSTTAKVNVVNAAIAGEPIPDNWALDQDGNPTTDARAGLAGSMSPSGGYKGVSTAMIVDLLAGGLTGSSLSHSAAPFGDNSGGYPNVGQLFLAFDPNRFSDDFSERSEAMFSAMLAQKGVRLPGERRLKHRLRVQTEGVSVPQSLLDKLNAYVN